MAYSAINVGTIANDGTGDTLFNTMTKVNSNDADIDANIDTEITNRGTALADCAKHNTTNVFSSPIATDEYQTLEGNSISLDFSVEKPHNFYLPHGLDIYLDAPVNLPAGFYASGWILTEGFITNWEDTFVEGDDNTKPLSYTSYSGQGLYLYYVLSPTVIVFRKFKTQQITEVSSDVLYPVTFIAAGLNDSIIELEDGTYVTQLKIEWTKNVSDTTDQFRVVISNGTDNVFDSTVIDTTLIVSPIKDTGIEHTVTIYATNGRSLSTPVSLLITPSGDSSTLQGLSTKNLTLSSVSLWGRNDLGDTTFFLDGATGEVTLGDTEARNVYYDADTGVLNLTGTLRTVDIGDPTITEYGKIATGTADYDVTTGVSGTGVLLGTPGIYGVSSDEFTFAIDNSGNVVIGSDADNRISFTAATGKLETVGENRITDVGDPVTKYGYFGTGTAAYDTATETVSGSGILLGSPGLFGVYLGEITFHINPTTGQLWMKEETTIIGDEPTSGSTPSSNTNLANDAQRTADIALKNTLDVNLIVDTLSRATTLTHNGVTTAFTFNI